MSSTCWFQPDVRLPWMYWLNLLFSFSFHEFLVLCADQQLWVSMYGHHRSPCFPVTWYLGSQPDVLLPWKYWLTFPPSFKMLFVTKPDIFCIPCKLRVCKFPKNSMDVDYMHPEIKDQGMKVLWEYYISEDFWCLILNLRTCTVVIHTIFWNFINPRLTSPLGPIRYSISMSF